jgi:hypothetical protein
MAAFGSNNFFRLMNSLDDENINPLRNEGAIALQANALEDSIMALSPSFTRMGLDMSVFSKATTSLKELPQTWRHFIAQQAKEILSGDMNRLLANINENFTERSIKSSEINAIVNFVLSYYEVIHRRAINKKEVIEGVLMRGLIKKSSFYQKISVADRDHEGILTWDASQKNQDDIWRHFTLQTCRFLKQATGELEDLLEDPQDLRNRLQKLLDQAEQEQFNQGVGKRSLGTFLPLMLFGLGLAGLTLLPAPVAQSTNSSMAVDSANNSSKASQAEFKAAPLSASYASSLPDDLQIIASNTHLPVSVDSATTVVKFKP